MTLVVEGRAGRASRALRGSSVVRAASALYSSTVVTSVLGFAFWALAARVATTAAVGEAGAAVALMQFMGSFATFGLGSLLIAELARRPERRVALVREAMAVSIVLGGALSALVAVGAAWVTRGSLPMLGGTGAVVFAFGAATATAGQVVDHALIGVQRSTEQLVRNSVASAVKLAVLGGVASALDVTPTWVFLAWAIGNLVSLLVVLTRTDQPARWVAPGRWSGALRGLGRAAGGHHAINLSGQVSLFVLPLVVAGVLGPEANAGFYLAMQIAAFAWVVPLHLATALFAVSSADPDRLRHELRLAMAISAAITGAGVVATLVLGRFVLGIYGAEYADSSATLGILIAATLPTCVLGLYITVCRVRGQLGRGAVVLLVESILQVVGGAIGSRIGVEAVAVGILVPTSVCALAVWPAVARAGHLTPWGGRARPAVEVAAG